MTISLYRKSRSEFDALIASGYTFTDALIYVQEVNGEYNHYVTNQTGTPVLIGPSTRVDMLEATQGGGGIIFSTIASLNSAAADYEANQKAEVLEDKGVYQKQGASGGGTWARIGAG